MNRLLLAIIRLTVLLCCLLATFTAAETRTPRYWVAPMDPQYKQDKPGKSPMGMDLVPVYAQDNETSTSLQINPQLVQSLGLKTAEATKKHLEQHLRLYGKVALNASLITHIHPRTAGWINKLYINAQGDQVKKGQALYDLYSPELVDAQGQLVVGLQASNQPYINAAKARLLALNMSRDAIDTLIKTRQVKQTVTFYAPQAGFIEHLQVREGYYVEPRQTLLSIGSKRDPWIIAEAPASFSDWLKPGLTASISPKLSSGKAYAASLDYIYPEVDSTSRALTLRLTSKHFDNDLTIGQYVNVTIERRAEHPRLIIPIPALIRDGQTVRVIRAINNLGEFAAVEVTIGNESQDEVEILRGLNEGDQVVTQGQFLLDSEANRQAAFKRLTSENTAHQVQHLQRHPTLDNKENTMEGHHDHAHH